MGKNASKPITEKGKKAIIAMTAVRAMVHLVLALSIKKWM
jgi:hypothetical protein